MNEFQYYEFQKIDGQLSLKAIQEIKKQSSKAKINLNQAIFIYNDGDFPGKAEKMLASYFDIMLYSTNGGSKQLSFRLPKQLVDVQDLRVYEHARIVKIKVVRDSVILSLFHDNKNGGDLIEENDLSFLLSNLSGLRKDILMRDYRCLYLTWLAHYTADAPEINRLPIPINLQELSPELSQFVDFFEISLEALSPNCSK